MRQLNTDVNKTSFNIISALNESSIKEAKITKKAKKTIKMNESAEYYNDDYNERTKYLIQDISDIKAFATLLMNEFGEEEPDEDDYNYEEGCHVVPVGGTTFYISEDLSDIWSYDDDPDATMEELLSNDNITKFLLNAGLVSEAEEDEDFEDDDYVDYEESSMKEASANSVKKQINTDKPEEAPKETKEALIKKVQNPKIPVKNALKEEDQDVISRLINGDKVYFRDEGNDPFVVMYAENYPQPTDWNEGYFPQNGGSQEELDAANLAAENGDVWALLAIPQESNLDVTGEVIGYAYGKNELEGILDGLREVKVVSRLEEAAEPRDTKSIQDQIAELQDYLDNTPEIAEDERTSIQAEIDELLDEVNYYENGIDMNESESLCEDAPNMDVIFISGVRFNKVGDNEYESDDNRYAMIDTGKNIYDSLRQGFDDDEIDNILNSFYTLDEIKNDSVNKYIEVSDDSNKFVEIYGLNDGQEEDGQLYFESALTEAPNPENAEVNRKILNTIRTKRHMEPKYRKDLEDLGLKLDQDKYDDAWTITGSNGRILTKNDFMGGRNATFNSDNNKVADYYNLLTKEDPNLKDKHWGNRNRRAKPTVKMDPYGHVNDETGKWEPKPVYTKKDYNQRQSVSRGYDFNDLSNGSKNINDYNNAVYDRDRLKVGSHSNNYDNDRVRDAELELSRFKDSISSKIKELEDRVSRAKTTRDDNIQASYDAEKQRQTILNNARAKRAQK